MYSAQIENPFTATGFQRNPANKNAGKFITLADFLDFSKAKAVTGVMINIEARLCNSKMLLNLLKAASNALFVDRMLLT